MQEPVSDSCTAQSALLGSQARPPHPTGSPTGCYPRRGVGSLSAANCVHAPPRAGGSSATEIGPVRRMLHVRQGASQLLAHMHALQPEGAALVPLAAADAVGRAGEHYKCAWGRASGRAPSSMHRDALHAQAPRVPEHTHGAGHAGASWWAAQAESLKHAHRAGLVRGSSPPASSISFVHVIARGMIGSSCGDSGCMQPFVYVLTQWQSVCEILTDTKQWYAQSVMQAFGSCSTRHGSDMLF